MLYSRGCYNKINDKTYILLLITPPVLQTSWPKKGAGIHLPPRPLAFIIWLALCICAMPAPQHGDVIYNKINDIKSYILLLTSPVLQSGTMFSDSFV